MEQTLELGKVNVLIIDDVMTNLILEAKIVTKLGYIARPVRTIEQARNALAYTLPHLILLDISMPETSGFEFCSEIKKNPEYKQIPIIFVTGYDASSYKKKAYQLGAVDYIVKPFYNDELAHKVKFHVQNVIKENRLLLSMQHLQKVLQDEKEEKKREKRKVIEMIRHLMRQGEADESHLQYMGQEAKLLAESLQLHPNYSKEIDRAFVERVETVAPIYDIGMLAVSQSILQKPARLSEEEMEEVRQHTTHGVRPLAKMLEQGNDNPYLQMAWEIAANHHERYDGSGYPNGTKGNEIPLAARMVSVLSVYHALRRSTCYREAYTREECLELMKEESGQAFDPEIIMVFFHMEEQLHKDEGGNQ